MLAVVTALAVSAGAAGAALPASLPLHGTARLMAVTGSSVAVAVTRPGTECTGVTLWTRAASTAFPALGGCEEGLSGGAGVGAVATSGTRAVWTSYACGNTCDWLLRTATPTRPVPRTLRLASREAGDPSPIVVGRGSVIGVPYAVNRDADAELVLLGDDGAATLRATVEPGVALLAAGPGPGSAVIAVAWADGKVATLRADGSTASTATLPGGAVSALALSPLGVVVQVGREVRLMTGDAVRQATTLPTGARMLGYATKRVLYAVGPRVRVRSLVTGAEAPAVTGITPIAGLSATTLAWARGATAYRSPAPR